MTPDGEKVVYRAVGRLGPYCASPVDEFRQTVDQMVTETKDDFGNDMTNFVDSARYDNAKALLRKLNRLQK
ncbi:hypothetical protein A2642_03555 [Candidatus Nomurabacteria bacterium RIFCSPHIGHO2_01_FULL_39_10]|uniref:Uncharacterized protein n=1 Tax=Candidatus Nomurabacteria bacterium RIFCSPHIGHO2_01_FULL_39_10 TaxID=1801733 RepID=A0A1F6VAK3_9BACT|nr:MAG: hypothetical protein A2642_03555 [Candidatus Nomurabacteria bacterium RIFCSPHIGHO2_01_FULL_39_10]